MNGLRKVYRLGGRDVVLVDWQFDALLEGVPIVECAGDVAAVAVEDMPDGYDNDSLLLSFDDQLADDYAGGDILAWRVVDTDNERRLLDVFVSQDYAFEDEAKRQLLVRTDETYEWDSERTKFEGAMYCSMANVAERWGDEGEFADALADLKRELREDWRNVCSWYNVPDYMDVDKIFKEMYSLESHLVSCDIRKVPDVEEEVMRLQD